MYRHIANAVPPPRKKHSKAKPLEDRGCERCGAVFQTRQPLARFCSKTCREAAYFEKTVRFKQRELSPGTRGAVSELVACTKLMEAGWHVFRAQSPACPCDLVAMLDGVSLLIEVRGGMRNLSSGSLTFNRQARDVCHVYFVVHPLGCEIVRGSLAIEPLFWEKLASSLGL